MSHIFFGLALISAALQIAWALFAEEQLLALPAVVLMLYLGWHKLLVGSNPRRSR